MPVAQNEKNVKNQKVYENLYSGSTNYTKSTNKINTKNNNRKYKNSETRKTNVNIRKSGFTKNQWIYLVDEICTHQYPIAHLL